MHVGFTSIKMPIQLSVKPITQTIIVSSGLQSTYTSSSYRNMQRYDVIPQLSLELSKCYTVSNRV